MLSFVAYSVLQSKIVRSLVCGLVISLLVLFVCLLRIVVVLFGYDLFGSQLLIFVDVEWYVGLLELFALSRDRFQVVHCVTLSRLLVVHYWICLAIEFIYNGVSYCLYF